MQKNWRSSRWFAESAALKGLAVIGALLVAEVGLAQGTNRPMSPTVMAETSFTTAASPGGVCARLNAGRIQTSDAGLTWTDRPLVVRTFLRGLTYGNGTFVAVGGSYLDEAGVILTSRDGGAWVRRNARNTTHLHGVTCGHGLFVAVGDGGAIFTSEDAVRWVRQRSGTPALLATVVFANGRFVAGGEAGTILASTNGTNWTQDKIGNHVFVGTITVRDGLFMVGSSHEVFVSTDGLIWRSWASEIASPPLTNSPLNGR